MSKQILTERDKKKIAKAEREAEKAIIREKKEIEF